MPFGRKYLLEASIQTITQKASTEQSNSDYIAIYEQYLQDTQFNIKSNKSIKNKPWYNLIKDTYNDKFLKMLLEQETLLTTNQFMQYSIRDSPSEDIIIIHNASNNEQHKLKLANNKLKR